MEFNEVIAFHPELYLSELIKDIAIGPEEFATRMAITLHTLKLLLNSKRILSDELNRKLSAAIRNSIYLWIKLHQAYDEHDEVRNKQKNPPSL